MIKVYPCSQKAQELKHQQSSASSLPVEDAMVRLTQDSSELLDFSLMDAIPAFDPGALSKAFESLQDASKWGPWRVVINSNDGRPFFFHMDSRMGQFEVPEQLLLGHDARVSGGIEDKAFVDCSSNAARTESNDERVSDDVEKLFPESSEAVESAVSSSEINNPGLAASAESANSAVDVAAATESATSSEEAKEWSCAVCTYLNADYVVCCEMCGTAAVSNSRPKRSISATQKLSGEAGSQTNSKKRKH